MKVKSRPQTVKAGGENRSGMLGLFDADDLDGVAIR